MLLADRDSRGPEISGPRIITEPLPGMENVGLGCVGENSDAGETPEPFIVIRNDGRDLGLLKHELGNEDRVGICRTSPGQIAAVYPVPGEKRAPERCDGGAIHVDEEAAPAR